MNNSKIERLLIALSLLSQAFGFFLLGSFMAAHPNADVACKIGGILALLAGTTFFGVTIKYWKYSRRFLQKRTSNVRHDSYLTKTRWSSPNLATITIY
jgi:hypothetical protein